MCGFSAMDMSQSAEVGRCTSHRVPRAAGKKLMREYDVAIRGNKLTPEIVLKSVYIK